MAERRVAGPATVGRMGDLHSRLCDLLMEMLEGEVVDEVDPETGEVVEVKLDPSPQVLNVTRAFLKDNEIVAAIDENEDMSSLQAKLLRRQQEAKGRRFSDDSVDPLN